MWQSMLKSVFKFVVFFGWFHSCSRKWLRKLFWFLVYVFGIHLYSNQRRQSHTELMVFWTNFGANCIHVKTRDFLVCNWNLCCFNIFRYQIQFSLNLKISFILASWLLIQLRILNIFFTFYMFYFLWGSFTNVKILVEEKKVSIFSFILFILTVFFFCQNRLLKIFCLHWPSNIDDPMVMLMLCWKEKLFFFKLTLFHKFLVEMIKWNWTQTEWW
jgi:hypothetical protein